MGHYIGLDIGSVSADLVVCDSAGSVLEWRYVRTFGQALEASLLQLRELLAKYKDVAGLCVTGSGAKIVSELLGVPFVNEIVAQSKAAFRLYPQVRTIIEIGGEDSKLIHVANGENGPRVADFALNSICAAGTGSFLEQQASRLRVSIEEFSRLALRSEHPPRIAGRCSVFAKSDMIHLQQQGAPDYDIIAGLCYAMARNFKSNLGKGKGLARPVAFQGGVALNSGMVAAFKDVLGLRDGEMLIPEQPGCTGALGAVLDVLERGVPCSLASLAPLEEYLRQPSAEAERLGPLADDGYELVLSCAELPDDRGKVDAYVGVDVGSISTNVVVIDSQLNVLARCYLMTEGRPLEAVKKALYEVGQKIAERVEVRGCCTTGSGRYLTGEFVGADIVKNEITSHARGAITADPTVDTIFEIGGQDAKYIALENGTVVDFAMNKACAAGTGSFLEEQSERLGLKIEEEFGCAALASRWPVKLGERCTVFMESDLNYHGLRGVPTDDLVSGLCYSIVHNYLNRVVEGRRIGNRIFFQGGVAFNRGVKAAFEGVLGKKVIVPPHHDVMGAVGAAILAREANIGTSNFRGFDLRDVRYELSSHESKCCSNRCEIHTVSFEGRKPLHYGSRCGKYDEKKYKKGDHLPRPFEERQQALLNSYPKDTPDNPTGITVGIPRSLTFYDLYPLWKAFFIETGCRVVLSEPTNRQTINKGADHLAAETCFPIQIAHGHIGELLEQDVDYIFMPSVVNMEHEVEKIAHSYVCPLVQSMPYLLRAAFEWNGEAGRPQMLAPIFHFERGRKAVSKQLRRMARALGVSRSRAEKAIEAGWQALDSFSETCRLRGEQILQGLGKDEIALVIISRAYNGCDQGMNLGIPDKLRDLGVLALPIDFLPLNVRDIQADHSNMYWKYGQRILAAARYIAGHQNLHAVYITNFRCGPDSFIIKFFSQELRKPYLTIEIDEHSSDVGTLTRCEAFLDSIRSGGKCAAVQKPHGAEIPLDLKKQDGKAKIYLPYMDDHGRLFAAVLRTRGVDAEALPMSDSESMEIGRRFTTGKECFPCILTTGDIVKKTQDPDFDPDRSAFFMAHATGPCRFGQYHKFHRMVLDEIGLAKVPMVVLDQTAKFSDQMNSFGNDFYLTCWEVLVIVDNLQKMLREIRPYESNPGDADAVYEQGLKELTDVVDTRGDYFARTAEIVQRLEGVPVDRSQERPRIGVIGEIYVRSHAFANNFLVRRLERIGAEVLVPPFQEWLNYIADERREICRQDLHLALLAKEWLTELAARKAEAKVARLFNGAIRHMAREQRISEVIKLGSRYLDPTIKGEAILSMGRALEYFERGLHGIVNVVPFGCMPGSIVNALLEKLQREHGCIPVLKLAYDGVERASEETVLEAFIQQAREYALSKQKRT